MLYQYACSFSFHGLSPFAVYSLFMRGFGHKLVVFVLHHTEMCVLSRVLFSEKVETSNR